MKGAEKGDQRSGGTTCLNEGPLEGPWQRKSVVLGQTSPGSDPLQSSWAKVCGSGKRRPEVREARVCMADLHWENWDRWRA